MSDSVLVLTTVNAAYSKKLDAGTRPLSAGPKCSQGRVWPHVIVFGDVKLQIAFAQIHGITHAQLVAAAKAFAAYSGQSYPFAA